MTLGGSQPEIEVNSVAVAAIAERNMDSSGKAGVNLTTDIRVGYPAQELVRAVTAHRADLFVLDRSGHSAIRGRFIGTTAERAARHVECSVLIANTPTT